jgi:hypothetical protein
VLGLVLVLFMSGCNGTPVSQIHQPTATVKLSAPYLLVRSAPMESVVWSPGGNLFAVAAANGSIGVWEEPGH